MKCNVESRESRVESRNISAHQRSTINHQHAFTLIELLVVITIIAILAAFIVPVAQGVARSQKISRARGEMAQLETAIDRYKEERGFYPPDNPGNPLTNQLYYELTGTTGTADPTDPSYKTFDGMQTLKSSELVSVFGAVNGFLNCTKGGGGEDAKPSKNFISTLNPNQLGSFTANGVSITNIVTAASGSDVSYKPMGVANLNPWRYVSSNPTNMQGQYELWVQLKIGNKTNLVCNWSKQTLINTPYP